MAVLFLVAAPFVSAGLLDDISLVLDGSTLNIVGLTADVYIFNQNKKGWSGSCFRQIQLFIGAVYK